MIILALLLCIISTFSLKVYFKQIYSGLVWSFPKGLPKGTQWPLLEQDSFLVTQLTANMVTTKLPSCINKRTFKMQQIYTLNNNIVRKPVSVAQVTETLNIHPPPIPSHQAYMPCLSGYSIVPAHKQGRRVHSRGG